MECFHSNRSWGCRNSRCPLERISLGNLISAYFNHGDNRSRYPGLRDAFWSGYNFKLRLQNRSLVLRCPHIMANLNFHIQGHLALLRETMSLVLQNLACLDAIFQLTSLFLGFLITLNLRASDLKVRSVEKIPRNIDVWIFFMFKSMPLTGLCPPLCIKMWKSVRRNWNEPLWLRLAWPPLFSWSNGSWHWCFF